MPSWEFPFCFFNSYAYICTCIRRHLKETIPSSSITWSEMGKQNIQAKEVYYVIAAMLVDKNKRFLICFICSSTNNCTLQHCYLCPSRLVANHLLMITITISEKQSFNWKKLLIEIFQNSHPGKYLQQRHYLKLQIPPFCKSRSRDGYVFVAIVIVINVGFSLATFLSINLISSFCTQFQLSKLISSFCTQKFSSFCTVWD